MYAHPSTASCIKTDPVTLGCNELKSKISVKLIRVSRVMGESPAPKSSYDRRELVIIRAWPTQTRTDMNAHSTCGQNACEYALVKHSTNPSNYLHSNPQMAREEHPKINSNKHALPTRPKHTTLRITSRIRWKKTMIKSSKLNSDLLSLNAENVSSSTAYSSKISEKIQTSEQTPSHEQTSR